VSLSWEIEVPYQGSLDKDMAKPFAVFAIFGEIFDRSSQLPRNAAAWCVSAFKKCRYADLYYCIGCSSNAYANQTKLAV
jgi:hypothetical protein